MALRKRLTLAAASTLVALAAVEAGLAVVRPVDFRLPPDWAFDFADALHQASVVPGLSYELRPGATADDNGVPVQVNSLGMRDAEPTPPAPGDRPRIAAVGDSVTYGFSVREAEAWPAALERELASEVHNHGVGGYSSQDEARVVVHKALPLEPDLLVLAYVLNDPETVPTQPLHLVFAWRPPWRAFHVGRLVEEAWFDQQVSRWGDGDYIRYLHAPEGPRWSSVPAAFGEIASAVGPDIPVLVVLFPASLQDSWSVYPYYDLHFQVLDAARAAGFDALDLTEVLSTRPMSEIRVGDDDGHPSALGHALAAGAIAEHLRARHPLLFEVDDTETQQPSG